MRPSLRLGLLIAAAGVAALLVVRRDPPVAGGAAVLPTAKAGPPDAATLAGAGPAGAADSGRAADARRSEAPAGPPPSDAGSAPLRLVFHGTRGEAPSSPVSFRLLSPALALADLADPTAESLPPIARGTTDAEGRGSVEVPYDSYELVVEGPYVLASSSLVEHEPTATEHELLLRRGSTLVGRVLSHHGTAAPGVRVGVRLFGYFDEEGPGPTSRANFRLGVTGADGSYVLDGVPRGAIVSVSAGGAGFATGRSAPVEVRDRLATVPDVVLVPEAVLYVEVVEGRGLLAPGDRFRLVVEEEFLLHVERRVAPGTAPALRIGALPAGRYVLALDSRRGRMEERALELDEGAHEWLAVRVTPRHPVLGSVVDANGNPIAGARIELRGPGGQETSTTDAAGAFRIGSVEPGTTAVLSASAFGFLEREMLLEAASGEGLRIRLDRGHVLDLSFIDEHGMPVSGVRVDGASVRAGEDPVPDLWTQSTEPTESRLVLSGFEEGRVFLFALGDGELATTWGADLGPSSSKRVETIALRPTQTLQGSVVDESGSPIEDARVHVQYGPWRTDPALAGVLPSPRSVRSDAAGAFRLERVLPDAGSLLVSKPGYEARLLEPGSYPAGFVHVVLRER